MIRFSLWRALALALGLVFGSTVLAAADAPQSASDPALDARVQRVAEELRCLVCQNQTIADSNAELAVDLRREVRAMLVDGASDAEVREFMVQRYGDFILYRPPFKATTVALWVGPFVLLIAGFWIHRRTVVARRSVASAGELTAQEGARLDTLLGPKHGSERS